ncbi:MAG: glycoside hydrolase family 88 protein [Saprospiraceae bacterium]|nr:glycoside hydrolase family 88 protein [Saprospiraceae bacterium]
MKNSLLTNLFLLFFSSLSAQTWIDSIDRYGREVYMPAEKYKWDWGQGTFLNALVHLYNEKTGAEKGIYLNYIKTAMNATYAVANGKHPNAVASGHGMAFLARVTKDEKYLKKAIEIYEDYLKTPRAANGGVSHRTETVEFWDDTVYMLSMFLLEMYRLTGDEKYIADFAAQTKAHSEKLVDTKTKLWVHGWDADNEDYDDKCSVVGWADKTTRKSSEIWGRANGWITMALADALYTIPKSSKYWNPLEKEFKNILTNLPSLQNKETGHWYQLLIYPNDKENFQESSCTAMFAYAMTMGMKMKILSKKKYQPIVDLAYKGLKKYSTTTVDGKYLTPSQVCGGTCIGGKEYYYKRKIMTGTGFGIGSFIMLGIEYDKMTK